MVFSNFLVHKISEVTKNLGVPLLQVGTAIGLAIDAHTTSNTSQLRGFPPIKSQALVREKLKARHNDKANLVEYQKANLKRACYQISDFLPFFPPKGRQICGLCFPFDLLLLPLLLLFFKIQFSFLQARLVFFPQTIQLLI